MPQMTTGPELVLIDVTLTTDTSAYASADLIADTQEVAGAVATAGGYAKLESVAVLDEDDQGVAFDIFFMQNSTSFGTENSAPNISDANARSNVLAKVAIATADYFDFGGAKLASVANIGRIVKAASGSTSIYVAVVNGAGTPTYSATGLKLRLGFSR